MYSLCITPYFRNAYFSPLFLSLLLFLPVSKLHSQMRTLVCILLLIKSGNLSSEVRETEVTENNVKPVCPITQEYFALFYLFLYFS